MKYKLVIFDFDGTLADTFPWLLTVMDQIADRHGFERIDHAEAERMRGYDARTLIKMYRVPFWKVILMVRDVRILMSRDVGRIKLFAGVETMLRSLSREGVKLAVVSTNSLDNVCSVLGPELAGLIDYYGCGVSVFGKQAKFRQVLKKSRLPAGDVFSIGDETRDIDAARSTEIACGAVAWGYANRDLLRSGAPDLFFERVEDILPGLS